MQANLSDFTADQEEDTGPYDPTDEFDELEESNGPGAIGDGRRKTLDALDAKGRLDDIQSFDSLEEMADALREISLARRDGTVYRAPPEDTIDTLRRVFDDLPDEAQPEYLNDDVIHRQINAARKAFNRWMGKKRREQEIPSPVEAGPSNYPAEKARETAQYAREGSEELDERIDKVAAAARGGRQRALEAIGSSVAEQNAQEAQSQIEQRREAWEPGDIVVYRSPNLHAGAIVRLNQKSVRVQRKNQCQNADWGSDDEHVRETIDLDSDFITRYEPADLAAIEDENLDRGQTVPEDLEAAQRQMLGDKWVEEHRDGGRP